MQRIEIKQGIVDVELIILYHYDVAVYVSISDHAELTGYIRLRDSYDLHRAIGEVWG